MLDDMFCDDALVLFVVWYSSFDGVFISNMGGSASYSGLRKKEKKNFLNNHNSLNQLYL